MKRATLEEVGLIASSPNPRQKEFHFATNYISEWYVTNLIPISTTGVRVVNLRLKPASTSPLLKDRVGHIMEVDREFDFDRFWRADEVTRKAMALTSLHEGLLAVAAAEGWDPEPFRVSYARCLGGGTVFERSVGDAVWNPGATLAAEVTCLFDSKEIAVMLIVHDRFGVERMRTVIARVPPHTAYLQGVLGRIRWRRRDLVEVTGGSHVIHRFQVAVQESRHHSAVGPFPLDRREEEGQEAGEKKQGRKPE